MTPPARLPRPGLVPAFIKPRAPPLHLPRPLRPPRPIARRVPKPRCAVSIGTVRLLVSPGCRRVPRRKRLTTYHQNPSPGRVHRLIPFSALVGRFIHLAGFRRANRSRSVIGVRQSVTSGRHRLCLERFHSPLIPPAPRHFINPLNVSFNVHRSVPLHFDIYIRPIRLIQSYFPVIRPQYLLYILSRLRPPERPVLAHAPKMRRPKRKHRERRAKSRIIIRPGCRIIRQRHVPHRCRKHSRSLGQ